MLQNTPVLNCDLNPICFTIRTPTHYKLIDLVSCHMQHPVRQLQVGSYQPAIGYLDTCVRACACV